MVSLLDLVHYRLVVELEELLGGVVLLKHILILLLGLRSGSFSPLK